MAENLNYNTNGSRCYDNKSSNCDQYGKLYSWNEAKTACPSGWHLPNPDEIQALITSAGGEEIAGIKVRTKSGWKGRVIGTDDYDFSALPAGSDDGQGSFLGMNYYSCWWSSTELSADSAHGFITGNFEDLVDSLTDGLLAQLGGFGGAISDICNPDLLSSMGLTPEFLSLMGINLDSNFGSGIFGKSLCDLRNGFDKMLMSGSEEKRRLISVRCLKDEQVFGSSSARSISSNSATNPISNEEDMLSNSAEEMKLYELMMQYRAEKGLPRIPISKSLTYVAKTHVRDLHENFDSFDFVCNAHSWSSKGNWVGCCYSGSRPEGTCMWHKPAELTLYTSYGYEIATYATGTNTMSAEGALDSWKRSFNHNSVIINAQPWNDIQWNAIGIGIYKAFATTWFGEELDECENQCNNTHKWCVADFSPYIECKEFNETFKIEHCVEQGFLPKETKPNGCDEKIEYKWCVGEMNGVLRCRDVGLKDCTLPVYKLYGFEPRVERPENCTYF
jgi:uncharacterized protein (TIGR02145 family)